MLLLYDFCGWPPEESAAKKDFYTSIYPTQDLYIYLIEKLCAFSFLFVTGQCRMRKQ
jgi:hypothetical protein